MAGLTPEQKRKIRKKLLMTNALGSEIKQAHQEAGKIKHKKRILTRIASGKILKKYRGLTWLNNRKGLSRNKMGGNLKKWFKKKKKRQPVQEHFRKDVCAF